MKCNYKQFFKFIWIISFSLDFYLENTEFSVIRDLSKLGLKSPYIVSTLTILFTCFLYFIHILKFEVKKQVIYIKMVSILKWKSKMAPS